MTWRDLTQLSVLGARILANMLTPCYGPCVLNWSLDEAQSMASGGVLEYGIHALDRSGPGGLVVRHPNIGEET